MADDTRTRIHELKTRETFFPAVWNGTKRAELRYDDRDFHNGDLLMLQEARLSAPGPGGQQELRVSGRWVLVRVTNLVRLQAINEALPEKWVMLSFDEVTRSEPS